MKNTCQDQNDSLHTPNIEKEKIEAAIQWIEDGAGFTHIREVPELLKESVQDHIFQSAEGHLEELVSNHKITLDEVAHAYHLMQISQGQRVGPMTRNGLSKKRRSGTNKNQP